MISFILPAHNEASLIGSTLQTLHTAAAELGVPFETIVVDDASTDGTGAIAEGAGARVLRVEYRHIAATRNAGAGAAFGERLFFIDADTHVDATVVRAAWNALETGAVGGGAVPGQRPHLAGPFDLGGGRPVVDA
jgi:glycosyltransferase involved in cell wall biosynthesis